MIDKKELTRAEKRKLIKEDIELHEGIANDAVPVNEVELDPADDNLIDESAWVEINNKE